MIFSSEKKAGLHQRPRYTALSRRKFLFISLSAAFVATGWRHSLVTGAGVATVASPTLQTDRFAAISQLLVGAHLLEPYIVRTAWQALSKKIADFGDRFSALDRALQQSKITSIELLNAAPVFRDAAHKNTIMQIISAYYLGRVGEAHSMSAEDRPAFITYTQAVMWDLTRDVSVIPTYSPGSPGEWSAPPGG